jgi:hypothetical protein
VSSVAPDSNKKYCFHLQQVSCTFVANICIRLTVEIMLIQIIWCFELIVIHYLGY